jgi:hypothetical protein
MEAMGFSCCFVIPGRDEVANYDAQLRIGESILPTGSYGFRACASGAKLTLASILSRRRIPE